jgi:hypothetical protein
MDQDRELFKLQVAAQHCESNLQMRVNYLDAFMVGALILSIGAYLANQVPWFGAILAWLACLLVSAWRLRDCYKEHARGIEKLDHHLQNLENGQPAPSLARLTKD